MNIKDLSIIELKALKSDLYEHLSEDQRSIQIINGEIAARSNNMKESQTHGADLEGNAHDGTARPDVTPTEPETEDA